MNGATLELSPEIQAARAAVPLPRSFCLHAAVI